MATNYEWLLHIDGERQAWFDAEHVDNTKSAKRAAAVERLRDYESWADDVDNCSLLKAVIGIDSWGIKWQENRDALIELLTDDDGLRNNDGVAAEHGATRMTNLERLFVDSEQFRQAVSAFAFAHSDDCPTSPTQMVDWLMAEHVDAQQDNNGTCPNSNETASNHSKAQSKDAPTLSEQSESLSDANDSREKLEADVTTYLMDKVTTWSAQRYALNEEVIRWLDRQAEITAEESAEAWEDYSDSVQREIAELQADNDERWSLYTESCEKIAELESELEKRDKGIARLKRQRDDARDAAEYWRGQVQLCLDSAYPKSHAPERGYDLNVMGYPDRHGCTTPSTLVSDVIDGLRDAAQDGFFKARLGDVVKLEAERDEWKAKAEQAKRAMNRAAGKWAKADEENRGLRKMLALDDGTVEDYTERADPLTALAHQKQLAEEWRDRCHNAEALCDKLEAERDALARDLAECEREREKWREKVGAMLDAADAIRGLA